jgi:4-amino-4-deoxy-L-arabinose transferase-like glycosyltransferase
MTERTESETRRRIWAFVLFGVAALLVAALRLRIADFPLERDEGEYAYFAQLLLQGVPPYAQAYTMKMPGTSTVYALALSLFGQTAFAIRLGLLLASLGTMALVFALGRRLVGEWAGAIAGAVYGLSSLSISVLGIAAHATHFVALFAAAGLLVLLRAIETRRAWQLFASGALLGIACTMKQHGVVFAAFGALWLLVESRVELATAPRAALRRVAAYCAGAAAPLAGVAIALTVAGVFDRFWFWNFVYAASYATAEPLEYALENLGSALGHMQSLFGFAALAGLGLLAPLFDPQARRPVRFLAALLLFSALAVVPGGYFREHYFIAMLPAVALLTGLGASALAHVAGRLATAALVLVAAAWMLASERQPLFTLPPLEFSRVVYGANPFPESIAVAEFVKAHTEPDERVAVLGSEPQIYFYARRRSASGHIYMYGLMEEHPTASRCRRARREVRRRDRRSSCWCRRSGRGCRGPARSATSSTGRVRISNASTTWPAWSRS